MVSSGLGFLGGSQDYTLVTYSQVALLNPNPGSNPQIENPSMTSDDYDGYDLTFSLGTWNSNSTYLTGEVLCRYAYYDCAPSKGASIMNGDGGVSALVNGPPSSNWLIWHSWSGSNRVDYAGPTSEGNVSSNSPEQSASSPAAEPPKVAQTPTQVVPYVWQQRVVNPNNPKLVIGYTASSTTISANAPPVAGPQTITPDR